jgi:hypothetical protein
VVAIPVILKPCAWQQTPLAAFNAVPRHGKPISQHLDKDSCLVRGGKWRADSDKKVAQTINTK